MLAGEVGPLGNGVCVRVCACVCARVCVRVCACAREGSCLGQVRAPGPRGGRDPVHLPTRPSEVGYAGGNKSPPWRCGPCWALAAGPQHPAGLAARGRLGAAAGVSALPGAEDRGSPGAARLSSAAGASGDRDLPSRNRPRVGDGLWGRQPDAA